MIRLFEKYQSEIEQILNNFPTKEAALIPLFHLVYKNFGHMNEETLEEIGEIINMPFINVKKCFDQYQIYWPDRSYCEDNSEWK